MSHTGGRIKNWRSRHEEHDTVELDNLIYDVAYCWKHETGRERVYVVHDPVSGEYHVVHVEQDSLEWFYIEDGKTSKERSRTEARKWMEDHPYGVDESTLAMYGYEYNDKGEIVNKY